MDVMPACIHKARFAALLSTPRVALLKLEHERAGKNPARKSKAPHAEAGCRSFHDSTRLSHLSTGLTSSLQRQDCPSVRTPRVLLYSTSSCESLNLLRAKLRSCGALATPTGQALAVLTPLL